MIEKLQEELAGGAYDAMTDQEVADALNAEIQYEATSISSGEIYNAVDPVEFAALTADDKQLLRDILSLGSVDVSDGTNARVVLISLFPGGTTTLASLAAAIQMTTTRAKQIGINRDIVAAWIAAAREV